MWREWWDRAFRVLAKLDCKHPDKHNKRTALNDVKREVSDDEREALEELERIEKRIEKIEGGQWARIPDEEYWPTEKASEEASVPFKRPSPPVSMDFNLGPF